MMLTKRQREKQNYKVRVQEILGEITYFTARKHKGLSFLKSSV